MKPLLNQYLDYNASAPLRPVVVDSVKNFLNEDYGNPTSIHYYGQKARNVVEEARKVIQIKNFNVFFTSGATEANNWILRSFDGPVIISEIEHDSIFHAKNNPYVCKVLPSGIIDLNHLEDLLKKAKRPALVSVMAANNETGIIQPLRKIIDLSRRYEAKIHTDAVQGIGRMEFDWSLVDAFSVSSHKLGGLSGSGALVVHQSFPLSPFIFGGGQEKSLRSGTENLIGIVSFKAAWASPIDWSLIQKKRNEFELDIIKRCPHVQIIGIKEERLPNTSYLLTPEFLGETQVVKLDLMGFSVSAGSACFSGKAQKSRVLSAMGYGPFAIRVSFGPEITDLSLFVDAFEESYNHHFLQTRHS